MLVYWTALRLFLYLIALSCSSKLFKTETKCLSTVHTHSQMAASDVTAGDFMSVPSTYQAVSAFGREQWRLSFTPSWALLRHSISIQLNCELGIGKNFGNSVWLECQTENRSRITIKKRRKVFMRWNNTCVRLFGFMLQYFFMMFWLCLSTAQPSVAISL